MNNASEGSKRQATRFRVTLVAYKRLEFSCIVEVPEEEDASASDMLPQMLNDVVDGTAYEEDLEY